ncbi:MAG: tyrosine-type recombinase/integrase [Clostridia bacterium]|nr:tyrosine-type recombinase/integrase [Clostridia bacterium]
MRSQWKPKGEIEHILAALMPENRLACEISLRHGLRIGDVLALPTDKVRKQRFTIREQKTGKTRAVRLTVDEVKRCLAFAGQHYVFEHRTNGRQHRTRQAVFKDLRRVAGAFRVKEHISTHSLRKVYAVEEYRRSGGDLKRVQRLLNHSSEAVTMLYAMADIVDRRKNKRR